MLVRPGSGVVGGQKSRPWVWLSLLVNFRRRNVEPVDCLGCDGVRPYCGRIGWEKSRGWVFTGPLARLGFFQLVIRCVGWPGLVENRIWHHCAEPPGLVGQMGVGCKGQQC